MTQRSPIDTLRSALDPKSIAVIGASENPNKVGGRPLRFLARFGFRGKVYPINPTRAEVQGMRCWPSLDALPEAPELVIVAVAGDAAFQAVRDCADKGVKVAVIMTGGLTESDPVHGKEKERAMVAYARERGMRIVGPNSQGIANFGTGAIASFSTMFMEVEPADGPVGIVSQSGAMSVVPYGLLRQRGIGIRHSHATGNDCDVTACEMAAIVAEDPDLRLLLLYLEGLPDPDQLARAAAVARERGLPIIAVKGGRTAAGQAAAASHTGALASEDRVIDAFFAQHGIWRARDMAEMVGGVELYLKGWKPRGRRLVVISTSGATCVMSADAASAAGMPLARFEPGTTSALRAALPPIAQAINPVDVTGALLTDSALFGRTLDALSPDPQVDAFFIGIPVTGAGYDVPLFAREAARCMAVSGKPVVFAGPQPAVAAQFRAAGVPAFAMETEAIGALDRFIAHHALMTRTDERAAQGLVPSPEAVAGRIRPGAAKPRMLDESASLARAADAGIPVIEHRLCASAEEAVAAWRVFGAPVAVKGCSEAVAHKSELGIVRLGVNDADAVAAAWRHVTSAMASQGIAHRGALVARMARGQRELMIGAHRDPVFGAAVVFGDGGKYVEALPDLRLLLAPFSRDEVLRAMNTLRIAPLIRGVRGEPPLDIDAFADAVVAIGRLMLDQPQVESLDLNPVLVGAAGEGCRALDAVVFERPST
jgi:acyl-CoA synthetase (NDP forming)